MDVSAESEAVAGLLAAGRSQELGRGQMAKIEKRVREVFRRDQGAMEALKRAQHGEPTAVPSLAAALSRYAHHDREFAKDLAAWASAAGGETLIQGRDQMFVIYPQPGEGIADGVVNVDVVPPPLSATAEIPQPNLSGSGKQVRNSGSGRPSDEERARRAAGPYEVIAHSRLDQALVVLLNAPSATAAENLERPPLERTIDVNAYLDTEDAVQASLVSRALDALGRLLGYDGPHDETIDRGSIFRRAKAWLQRGIDPDQAMKYRAKLEHAVELVAIGERQAKVDQGEASAFSTVINSIADIPSACLIVGSLLIVKFTDPQGPIVLVRPLSALELRTLERFPGIQRDPRTALETLATAVAGLEAADESSS